MRFRWRAVAWLVSEKRRHQRGGPGQRFDVAVGVEMLDLLGDESHVQAVIVKVHDRPSTLRSSDKKAFSFIPFQGRHGVLHIGR